MKPIDKIEEENEAYKKFRDEGINLSLRETGRTRHSNRSTERLKILHAQIVIAIQDEIEKRGGKLDDYKFCSAGLDDTKAYNVPREKRLKGMKRSKNVDIYIENLSDKSKRTVIAVKFPINNVGQNKNNYKEQLESECFNLKALPKPRTYFHSVFIQFENVHYFNRDGNSVKLEKADHNGQILEDTNFAELDYIDNPYSGVYMDSSYLGLLDSEELEHASDKEEMREFFRGVDVEFTDHFNARHNESKVYVNKEFDFFIKNIVDNL